MSDSVPNGTADPKAALPDGTVSKADLAALEVIAGEIASIKARAEAAASAAEKANAKANSESGFAFNAKKVTEEHATAISKIKGTVEADVTWLTTTKANIEQASQAITNAKSIAENEAQLITSLRETTNAKAEATSVAQDQATASLAVVKQAEVDSNASYKKVSKDAAAVAEARTTIEAGAATMKTLQTETSELAVRAKTDGESVTAALADAKTSMATMVEVQAAAQRATSNVQVYETKLVDLEKQFKELHDKTERLLPGATSAGLATAFRDQKSRFDQPSKNWFWIFIGSVFALLLVGLPTILATITDNQAKSWDELLRVFMGRLPVVAPLVWLGIYAGRNYMLALRMQEEYAFKEALSTSFEGYKREMATIAPAGADLKPILTLCDNVLRTLAQRPGRIYESYQEDITPFSAIKGSIGQTAAGVGKIIGGNEKE